MRNRGKSLYCRVLICIPSPVVEVLVRYLEEEVETTRVDDVTTRPSGTSICNVTVEGPKVAVGKGMVMVVN